MINNRVPTFTGEGPTFELDPYGITANTLPPGTIDTSMARQAEASGVCIFLRSEEADFITGHTVGLNGGWCMGRGGGSRGALVRHPICLPVPASWR